MGLLERLSRDIRVPKDYTLVVGRPDHEVEAIPEGTLKLVVNGGTVEKYVSRKQFSIFFNPETAGWEIKELGSANGTRLGRIPLRPEVSMGLEVGSEIYIPSKIGLELASFHITSIFPGQFLFLETVSHNSEIGFELKRS